MCKEISRESRIIAEQNFNSCCCCFNVLPNLMRLSGAEMLKVLWFGYVLHCCYTNSIGYQSLESVPLCYYLWLNGLFQLSDTKIAAETRYLTARYFNETMRQVTSGKTIKKHQRWLLEGKDWTKDMKSCVQMYFCDT